MEFSHIVRKIMNFTQEMDSVIQTALPGIGDVTLQNLIDKLNEIGVLGLDDLQYIEKDDITGILMPIQEKKFLKFCKNVSINTVSSSAEISFISQSGIDLNNLNDFPAEMSDSFNTLEVEHNCTLNKIVHQGWAENFEINWGTFPKEIQESGNNQPLKKHINEVVRILSVQILNINKNPGRKNLRIIATKVVQKYPSIFLDRCGETVIGNGCSTLLKKLENCIENKNRDVVLCEANFEGVRKRKIPKNSYGCINWQPTELPHHESKELQIQHKEWLLNEFCKNDRNNDEVDNLMHRTYASQRFFINNVKESIVSIKENWPFLLEEKYLLSHCEKLLGIDLISEFEKSMSEKGKKIFDYMKLQSKKPKIRDCIESIFNAKIAVGNFMPEVIGAIPLVMAYFNEDQTLLFKEKTTLVSSNDKEVLTPYITTLGHSIYTSEKFAIVIDGHTVTHTTSFTSALTLVFAAFYAFNIQYNEGTAHTMEFIQRCYANINPSKGSKATKKRHYAISPKVLKLVNGLKSFESVFNI